MYKARQRGKYWLKCLLRWWRELQISAGWCEWLMIARHVMSVSTSLLPLGLQTKVREYFKITEKAPTHGRMGTPVRNNFLSGQPKEMSKGPVDHTKKWVELWLAAVSPCRTHIGRLSPLPCLITSPSCWGTHFLYLSNPPSGNLLPIIPCYTRCLNAHRDHVAGVAAGVSAWWLVAPVLGLSTTTAVSNWAQLLPAHCTAFLWEIRHREERRALGELDMSTLATLHSGHVMASLTGCSLHLLLMLQYYIFDTCYTVTW